MALVEYTLHEPQATAWWRRAFTRAEWLRLAGLYGVVLLLHVGGWGLFLHYSWRYPSLVGLGLAAYMFGLRHAFDADHIAAVDDTVRYLMRKGRRPLGVGFFFSLGHSTIVFAMAAAVVFAAAMIKRQLPVMQELGGVIGAGVSGTFLWIIGILNLMVLLDVIKVWRHGRCAGHSHAHLEELLTQRGVLNRLFGGWLKRVVNHSWQMYPLGLLFGLGFDTVSEVGLLATAAGATATGIPVAAVFSLPILFAAGMSLMDTTDGVLMTKVYSWAFVNPLRKVFYNMAITTLSIAVALLIGTIEWLQVLIGTLHWRGRFFSFVSGLDFDVLGYLVVGLFLVTWGVSIALWKFGRIEARFGPQSSHTHVHEHAHDSGLRHVHTHFH